MADFTTSDGVRIDHLVRGIGPPLLACQGGPANIADTLAAALVPLQDAHTIVFHDYRGSGRSEAGPPESYTFERLADDLDELRLHLGYGAVPVLAHSMGGFVALNYALRHPEGCSGLVLVGTTPTGDPRKIALPALRALGLARLASLSPWPDYAGGVPSTLLGHEVHPSSAMQSYLSTASNSDVLVLGDFRCFYIIDRLGMQVSVNPWVVGTARRPTGSVGYAAFFRTGARLVDPTGMRLLRV